MSAPRSIPHSASQKSKNNGLGQVQSEQVSDEKTVLLAQVICACWVDVTWFPWLVH